MTLTPSGWQLETFALAGAAWMFGGALLAVALGALVGHLRSVETGLASGLLLWAIGNLLTAAAVAVFVHVDSTVLQLAPSRCEPLPTVNGQPMHQQFYRLAAAPDAREVSTPPAPGLCTEDQPTATLALRLRRDDIAAGRPLLEGDPADEEKAQVIMVVWSVFGGAGLLFALALLGANRAASAPRRPPAVVAPWRRSLSRLLAQLGLLLFLAAFVGPFFIDGNEERAVEFGLRCIASAMGSWLLSGLLAGTMTGIGFLFLSSFAGILLGLAALIT